MRRACGRRRETCRFLPRSPTPTTRTRPPTASSTRPRTCRSDWSSTSTATGSPSTVKGIWTGARGPAVAWPAPGESSRRRALAGTTWSRCVLPETTEPGGWRIRMARSATWSRRSTTWSPGAAPPRIGFGSWATPAARSSSASGSSRPMPSAWRAGASCFSGAATRLRRRRSSPQMPRNGSR